MYSEFILAPVVCFAKLVQTNSRAVMVEQYAPYGLHSISAQTMQQGIKCANDFTFFLIDKIFIIFRGFFKNPLFGSFLISLMLNSLKGVFSKPSGKYIVSPNLCFLSYRPQIVATCLFFISFKCAKFQQDWTTLILDIL